MIVYPMGLPPHDVIQQEFENTEDLSGTQASLEVIIEIIFELKFCKIIFKKNLGNHCFLYFLMLTVDDLLL